jgi:hypothetical protein
MPLYSLQLLLNTFSAPVNIVGAVLKMSAQRLFNSPFTLPISVCQNSTEVSLARQCSVQILGTFTKIAKSDY